MVRKINWGKISQSLNFRRYWRNRRQKIEPKVKNTSKAYLLDVKRSSKKTYKQPPPENWNPKSSDVKGIDSPSKYLEREAESYYIMDKVARKTLKGKHLSMKLRVTVTNPPKPESTGGFTSAMMHKYTGKSPGKGLAPVVKEGKAYHINLSANPVDINESMNWTKDMITTHEIGHVLFRELEQEKKIDTGFWMDQRSEALKKSRECGVQFYGFSNLAIDASKLREKIGDRSIARLDLGDSKKYLGAPTLYALSNHREYFAESYAYHVNHPAKFRRNFPKESKWIDSHLPLLSKKKR